MSDEHKKSGGSGPTVADIAKKVISSDGETAVECYDSAHGKWKDNVERTDTVKSSGGTKLDPSPITGGRDTK